MALHPKRLFWRYLISYVVVLLLPMVLFGLTLFLYSRRVISEQLLSHLTSSTVHTSEAVDVHVRQVYNSSYQIQQSAEFLELLRREPSRSELFLYRDLSRVLARHVTTNLLLRDIVYYPESGSYLVTSSGTSPKSIYFSRILSQSEWSYAELNAALGAIIGGSGRPRATGVPPGGAEQRYVTFVTRIGTDGASQERFLLFVLDADRMSTLLTEGGGTTTAVELVILDELDRPIYYQDSTRGPQTIQAIMPHISDSVAARDDAISIRTDVGDVGSYAVYRRSDATGLQYIRIRSTEAVFTDLTRMNVLAMASAAVLILIGSAAITRFMSNTYAPVHKLYQQARELSPAESPGARRDEIGYIRATLDEAIGSHARLLRSLERNLPGLKERLLSGLIDGRYVSSAELNEAYADAYADGEVVVHGEYITVFVITLETDAPESRSSLGTVVERHIGGGRNLFVRSALGSGSLVGALVQDRPEEIERETELKELAHSISVDLGVSCTVGVGRCSSLAHAGRSYIEALSANEHKLIHGTGRAIFFSELTLDETHLQRYPHAELERLQSIVCAGDPDAARTTVSNLVRYVRGNGVPVFFARALHYDLTGELRQAIARLHFGADLLTDSERRALYSMAESQTIEQSGAFAVSIAERIRDFTAKRLVSETDRRIQGILAYINEHAYEIDFSLQRCAERFSTSPSSLSIEFKEHTGTTFRDYVAQLRIARARELLSTTDFPFKRITALCGYSDLSSFTRKFKAAVGVSPGRYRENPRSS